MPLTADTLLVQDSEPTRTTQGEEVMMLSARAGAYFGLNKVGSEIWAMLAQPRSVGEVCQALAQLYQVEADVLAAEVHAFLQQMLSNGLLRVPDPGELQRMSQGRSG